MLDKLSSFQQSSTVNSRTGDYPKDGKQQQTRKPS